MKKVIEHNYVVLKFISFLFNDFDIHKYLYGYKGKILLLHSVDDDIIPYKSIFEINKYITKHIPMSGSHKKPIIPWEDIKIFLDKDSLETNS